MQLVIIQLRAGQLPVTCCLLTNQSVLDGRMVNMQLLVWMKSVKILWHFCLTSTPNSLNTGIESWCSLERVSEENTSHTQPTLFYLTTVRPKAQSNSILSLSSCQMSLLMSQQNVLNSIILDMQSVSMTTSRLSRSSSSVKYARKVLDATTQQMSNQLLERLSSTTSLNPQVALTKWTLAISITRACQTLIHSKICSNTLTRSIHSRVNYTSPNLTDFPSWTLLLQSSSRIEKGILLGFTHLSSPKASRFWSTLVNSTWRMVSDRLSSGSKALTSLTENNSISKQEKSINTMTKMTQALSSLEDTTGIMIYSQWLSFQPLDTWWQHLNHILPWNLWWITSTRATWAVRPKAVETAHQLLMTCAPTWMIAMATVHAMWTASVHVTLAAMDLTAQLLSIASQHPKVLTQLLAKGGSISFSQLQEISLSRLKPPAMYQSTSERAWLTSQMPSTLIL